MRQKTGEKVRVCDVCSMKVGIGDINTEPQKDRVTRRLALGPGPEYSKKQVIKEQNRWG